MKRLALLLLLAACTSSPTGPGESRLPSGSYAIVAYWVSAPGLWWPSPGDFQLDFTIRVVESTANRVVFDWTAGDVRGTLPVRDTADVNADGYVVTWNGATDKAYTLRFVVGHCVFGEVGLQTLLYDGCSITPT